MSSKKCGECEKEIKEHVKLCLTCLEELKNDKYNDFVFVMASLNNTLSGLLSDLDKLTKENESLKKSNESLNKENISLVVNKD